MVNRRIESWNRVYNRQMQTQASMDLQLANLIGISVGRCLSSDVKMPTIYEAYPELFSQEEIQNIKQQQQTELNVARFMEFATAHNLNRKGGGVNGC